MAGTLEENEPPAHPGILSILLGPQVGDESPQPKWKEEGASWGSFAYLKLWVGVGKAGYSLSSLLRKGSGNCSSKPRPNCPYPPK